MPTYIPNSYFTLPVESRPDNGSNELNLLNNDKSKQHLP